jgi:hypothetical protein
MLLVVERLMIVAACGAMSSGPDSQDACWIGAVSPEQYRPLAAEVAAQAPTGLRRSTRNISLRGVAAALRQRLEQVLAGRMSADEQIAAMHAQMCSIGAELRYAQRSADATVAGYRYRLDVNRIGMTRLLSRWAQIHIRFERSPAHDDRPALERVVAMMPEMLEPSWPGWKKPDQEQLYPPAPTGAPTFQERLDEYTID